MSLLEEAKLQYHGNARHEILHLVDPEPGRILDIGGGNGATAALLKAQRGAPYAAVIDNARVDPLDDIDDFYVDNIDKGQKLQSLEKAGERFDTILCLDVLEHLYDPWGIVENLRDLLTPRGSIIISVPNMRNYRLTFPLFFSGKFDLEDFGVRDRTHIRWFVRDTAIKLATPSGLILEQVEGGWYKDRATRIERFAKYGIAQGFLYQNYFLKSRRI